jgi:hypothetical protein
MAKAHGCGRARRLSILEARMTREDAKSVEVVGTYENGDKIVLRRFSLADEKTASEWALRQPMLDYEDIGLEYSGAEPPRAGPFSREVEFIYDFCAERRHSGLGRKNYERLRAIAQKLESVA